MNLNEFMVRSGIPCSVNGFRYIKCAIEKSMEGLRKMKDINSSVAEEFNSTSIGVDRAIFTAIKHHFSEMDEELKKEVFPTYKDTPSNKEYIFGVANYLNSKM